MSVDEIRSIEKDLSDLNVSDEQQRSIISEIGSCLHQGSYLDARKMILGLVKSDVCYEPVARRIISLAAMQKSQQSKISYGGKSVLDLESDFESLRDRVERLEGQLREKLSFEQFNEKITEIRQRSDCINDEKESLCQSVVKYFKALKQQYSESMEKLTRYRNDMTAKCESAYSAMDEKHSELQRVLQNFRDLESRTLADRENEREELRKLKMKVTELSKKAMLADMYREQVQQLQGMIRTQQQYFLQLLQHVYELEMPAKPSDSIYPQSKDVTQPQVDSFVYDVQHVSNYKSRDSQAAHDQFKQTREYADDEPEVIIMESDEPFYQLNASHASEEFASPYLEVVSAKDARRRLDGQISMRNHKDDKTETINTSTDTNLKYRADEPSALHISQCSINAADNFATRQNCTQLAGQISYQAHNANATRSQETTRCADRTGMLQCSFGSADAFDADWQDK